MRGGQTVGLLGTLAVAVGLVAACGRTDEAVAPEETTSAQHTHRPEPSDVAARFVGTEWRLTRLQGREPLEGTSITLEVDRDAGRIEVGGVATCNFYGLGNPTMRDGVLSSRGVGMTEVGCTGQRGRQENAYLDALGEAATYRVRGNTLEVQNSEGTTLLAYEQESLSRSNPKDLVGTRWLLRSVDGRPLPADFPATVSFDSEKKVSGYDGCRHFTGRYFANENDLTVPDFGYGLEDCLKPGAYGRNGPVRALENMPLEGNYTLGKGRLEVRGDSGAVSVFEPLAAGVEVEEPGPAWVLEQFVEEGEATPVLNGTEITLKFDRGTLRSSGKINGSAGCNTYHVPYQHPVARNGPDRLDVGNPSVTKKTCPFPTGVMEQEQRYLKVLADVSSYPSLTIDGRMRLETEDGRALVFSAPE